MRYRVWPYRPGSRGASALAEALGGKVLKREGSRFVVRRDDVIVNWGDTDPPPFVTKNRDNVRVASNKLLFFQRMREAGHSNIIPQFWTNSNDIPADVYPIVCRTVLAGHSGDGIHIARTVEELVRAPLYVQYQKKSEEYRVHCTHEEVIAVQRKARRHDTADEDVNWQVRNHDNGFVFVRGGFTADRDVIAVAQTAVGAVGLDFGACDIIWNAKQERAYVLEINTAPGLEGQTVEDYARFFRAEVRT